MPRISPATRRPPLMQSSIAYSSATRTGLLSGTRLPNIAMRIFFVGYTRAAPMRLQFAISPYGLKWCSLQPTQSKPQRSAYTIVSTYSRYSSCARAGSNVRFGVGHSGVTSFTPVNGIKWKKQNFKAGSPEGARVLYGALKPQNT
jgi:hypothetical protein